MWYNACRRVVSMMIVKISERGQISIPASMRKKLGIKPKSKVSVDVGEKEIVIRPVKSVLEVAGIFHESAKGMTTDWETIREQAMEITAREIEDETD
jgi:AbrB family looped-hinge helix DNA binding protein